MPHFSKISKARLATCHGDLHLIFKEVIRDFDCTIVCGHRSVSEQQELYAQGRTKPGKVVTHVDGVNKKSKHNSLPSMAVDAVPYPINWNDTDRMRYFAGFVMGTAARLYHEGLITHHLRWGGDWDRDTEVKDNRFMDLPHFELVSP